MLTFEDLFPEEYEERCEATYHGKQCLEEAYHGCAHRVWFMGAWVGWYGESVED